ncbi:DUF2207 domain-containing protein [Lactiplantibacillus modestisalitolerans]|uniref:DUF2207 domain-containing protein n=1 Tax=Lactiplantibacillus modestisalitolerans TaxID=1457219 RepID=A0ABV5WR43_9LACO|nr:DUF2207 domain-containing protein [Lactiplantibacillus modestisalitolerans]
MRQRRMRWWVVLLTTMLGVVAFIYGLQRPLTARADYEVTKYRVNVAVRTDGSADVRQAVTYDFDDSYHGVFNVQDLRGINGAQLQGVTTRLNKQAAVAATAQTNERDQTYQVTQNKERMRVKVYRSVQSGDQLTVTYRYRLLGVVTNYADTAELNWKIIGTGWDVDLQNVRLQIQLPARSIKQLQAWTHGPLSGHTQVDRKRGRVTMTLAENPENEFVESHLLFPTSVTAANQKTSTKQRKAAAQKQEAALVAKANQKRKQQRAVKHGVVLLAVAVWLILAGYYLYSIKRRPVTEYQAPIPLNHSFDVPPVSPAVAEALWSGSDPNANALTGELLVDAAQRTVDITVGPEKRRPNVTLTRNGTLTNAFWNQCFDQVGRDGQFTLKQLKTFSLKDKKGRLQKGYHRWQKDVIAQTTGYKDAGNQALLNQLKVAPIVMFFTGIVMAGLGFLWSPQVALGLAVLATSGFLGFVGYYVHQRKRVHALNDRGLALVNQINGLQRMLKDIGHFNTAQVGDLVLWEQLLPYAAAFGLAKQVTKQLAVDFGEAALETNFIVYYPLFYANAVNFDLSSTINHSVNNAVSSSGAMSNTAGGSGGFSGGSSGGFGGGSGGGAF